MRLYLVQHGDALPKDVDPDRPLSELGQADVQRLTRFLSRHDVRVAQIFHSGKTRARETAEICRPLLESDGQIQEHQGLAANDAPDAFLGELNNIETDTLVASHMPFVARTVSQALTGSPDRQMLDFVPGSVAAIERFGADSWRLFMFVRPDLV